MSPGVYKGKNRTYQELIIYAIMSTDSKQMTLSQIYAWMMQNVPQFKEGSNVGPTKPSWQNSIRHNLSLHKCFQKKPNEVVGESNWWIYCEKGSRYNSNRDQRYGVSAMTDSQKRSFHSGQMTNKIRRQTSSAHQTCSANDFSFKVAPNAIFSHSNCNRQVSGHAVQGSIQDDEDKILNQFGDLHYIVNEFRYAECDVSANNNGNSEKHLSEMTINIKNGENGIKTAPLPTKTGSTNSQISPKSPFPITMLRTNTSSGKTGKSPIRNFSCGCHSHQHGRTYCDLSSGQESGSDDEEQDRIKDWNGLFGVGEPAFESHMQIYV